jgi:hypothetical protein
MAAHGLPHNDAFNQPTKTKELREGAQLAYFSS